ncbi:MAG: GNAT family N-acetyltransferase [Bacteroidetes bacterium]|nr:MAG: GNAT family N-acetyltransferase [Bacteroidota bacterium]
MIFREATPADIPQIQVVRHAVKENTLSDPALVTDADCEDYLTRRGKGWVCECEGQVVGFSIGDLQAHNVWALFVHPDYEAQGIGKHLHDLMLQWYFSQTSEMIWLGTSPGTRAAVFYARQGWKSDGELRGKELRFEMRREDWAQRHVG